ncbi:uncharacterized protein LOC109827341 [Asparagus officinalis]|uniref:uncharacterized protein LOC109827341 n=1 Tax=Asparagus officinalis TaxID=4686 RepID=UPI00098E2184|nr:uncharacterized protein LOC109827341 [Asparagus officinalis]
MADDRQQPSTNPMSKTPNQPASDWKSTKFPKPPQTQQYPNPPDPSNPDPATLREQWRFAIRQYGKWYSHAWGTAILAGVSFFALGWLIKGSNPLPSLSNPQRERQQQEDDPQSSRPND